MSGLLQFLTHHCYYSSLMNNFTRYFVCIAFMGPCRSLDSDIPIYYRFGEKIDWFFSCINIIAMRFIAYIRTGRCVLSQFCARLCMRVHPKVLRSVPTPWTYSYIQNFPYHRLLVLVYCVDVVVFRESRQAEAWLCRSRASLLCYEIGISVIAIKQLNFSGTF